MVVSAEYHLPVALTTEKESPVLTEQGARTKNFRFGSVKSWIYSVCVTPTDTLDVAP